MKYTVLVVTDADADADGDAEAKTLIYQCVAHSSNEKRLTIFDFLKQLLLYTDIM